MLLRIFLAGVLWGAIHGCGGSLSQLEPAASKPVKLGQSANTSESTSTASDTPYPVSPPQPVLGSYLAASFEVPVTSRREQCEVIVFEESFATTIDMSAAIIQLLLVGDINQLNAIAVKCFSSDDLLYANPYSSLSIISEEDRKILAKIALNEPNAAVQHVAHFSIQYQAAPLEQTSIPRGIAETLQISPESRTNKLSFQILRPDEIPVDKMNRVHTNPVDPVAQPTNVPTVTPAPTAMPVPSQTPLPTATPTPPRPTATPTPPRPTATPTPPRPTATPTPPWPTATPTPPWPTLPWPTATPTPLRPTLPRPTATPTPQRPTPLRPTPVPASPRQTGPQIIALRLYPNSTRPGEKILYVVTSLSSQRLPARYFSFDGGVSWSTQNAKSFPLITMLKMGSIRVRDSNGNESVYRFDFIVR